MLKKLRKALKANHTFNAEFDAEYGWVIFSNYSMLQEFESRNLERNHKEAWYQGHIWSMIETFFNRINNLDAVVGGSASMGSKKRKN